MACGTSFVFSPYFPSTDNRSIVLVWLEIDTKNKTFRRFTWRKHVTNVVFASYGIYLSREQTSNVFEESL